MHARGGGGEAGRPLRRGRHLSLRIRDEEAIDMLESAKDRIFAGPAIGIILRHAL